MSGRCWKTTMIVAVVVAMASLTNFAEAQTVSTCAEKLTPCLDYINTTTTPPASCCTPIKQTVATELTCLCNLYNTPGLLANFGITVEQALNLSTRCGVNSTLSSCNVTAPSPSSVTPPATPGGDNNGAGRVTLTGLSFLLLFWASLLFH